jgi:hypothetical protein
LELEALGFSTGEILRALGIDRTVLQGPDASQEAKALAAIQAARQSTSVLICLGLAHAPSFSRAICSIPSFGNSEIRRERLVPRDTSKNANKPDGCGELLRVFSTRH